VADDEEAAAEHTERNFHLFCTKVTGSPQMTAENLCNGPTAPAPVCYSGRVMSKRRHSNIHEDTIDSLLDRLSDTREELLAIERSLERIQAQQGKDGFAGSLPLSRSGNVR
jgi:hypothetical protein